MLKALNNPGSGFGRLVFGPPPDTHTDLDLRVETKFVSELNNIDSVTRWIKGYKAGFKKLHHPRQINNIYFDTFDYLSYGENLAGISRRIKARLRWYGETREVLTQPVMEFKNRIGKQGWKNSFQLENIDLSLSWDLLQNSIRHQLPPEGEIIFLSFPMPTLINQYRRNYFLSSDGKLRITVDEGIKVFDQRNSNRPKFYPGMNMPDYIVVEFKYHRDDFLVVGETIKDFPLRPSRSSKYVTGMKAIVEAV